MLLGWFVAMWLPLTLVSGLLDPGFIRINASLMRYWVPILPALVLGAAGFVAWLLARLRDRLPEERRGVGVTVTAAVAVVGLAVAVVPLLPRSRATRATRPGTRCAPTCTSTTDEIDTIVTDDRDALILGIYSREPVGGDLVVNADVEEIGHELKAPPVAIRRPWHLPGLDAGPVAEEAEGVRRLEAAAQGARAAPLRPDRRLSGPVQRPGGTFWLSRNRFVGSRRRFSATRRAQVGAPYASRTRSVLSSASSWLT